MMLVVTCLKVILWLLMTSSFFHVRTHSAHLVSAAPFTGEHVVCQGWDVWIPCFLYELPWLYLWPGAGKHASRRWGWVCHLLHMFHLGPQQSGNSSSTTFLHCLLLGLRLTLLCHFKAAPGLTHPYLLLQFVVEVDASDSGVENTTMM